MIKVGTYNTLDPQYARLTRIPFLPSGGGNWTEREAAICQNLRQADLDIFSLQEISVSNFQTLKQRLGPTYQAVYAPHRVNSDGVALFFKAGRFRIEQQSTPSYTNSANQTRYSIVCDLRDQQTQQIYRIAGAHIFGGPQREHGDRQLIQLLQTLNNSGPPTTILLGDFNEDLNVARNQRPATLQSAGFRQDGSTEESEIDRRRKIDGIFAKSTLPMAIQPLPLRGQITASDHRLVASQIHLTLPSIPAPQPIPAPIHASPTHTAPAPSSAASLPFWHYLNPLKWLEWFCNWLKQLRT
jgi:endonuclease/exonuclease/phosphatase family metal-dependent hydrolase